jgi:hypothetical protein
MRPDFQKLCIAIHDFIESINDCTKFSGFVDIKEILDLHFNDVITNQECYNLPEWKWQLINTLAAPKMGVDEEIINLMLDLENSSLSIHISNWANVIQKFINEYFKIWGNPNGYAVHITEIDNEFMPYTKNKKNPNWSETEWVIYGIVMNCTTKKTFIAINNLVLNYSMDIPNELQQTINLYRGALVFKEEPQTPTNPILPPELSTPEAMKYWEKAQEAGLVDDNFQWTGENKAESALFAECFSKALNIKHKWKYFKRLWNINDFAQIRHKTTTEYLLKIDPEREKLIASIFI